MQMPILWVDFSSAPVNITTEQVYAVKSYGTSASPFYTILALWFGGLILVAIMHTPVHPAPDIPADAKRYEKFLRKVFYLLCSRTASGTAYNTWKSSLHWNPVLPPIPLLGCMCILKPRIHLLYVQPYCCIWKYR